MLVFLSVYGAYQISYTMGKGGVVKWQEKVAYHSTEFSVDVND
jgi:hypothetical protein